MNKNDYIIRLEKKEDYHEVENLVRESFWNVYRPGCLEHYVFKCLREDKDFVPELDFVMEMDGRIIGQNIFVRTDIKADDGRNVPIMTMGLIRKELRTRGDYRITVENGEVMCVESFDFKRFSGFWCKNWKKILASGRGFEETENDAKIVLRLEDYSPEREEAWHRAKNT